MTRTASEVLIELENKINKVLQLAENNSFTNQLILNKLNKLEEQSKKNKSKGSAIFAEAADVKSINSLVTNPETVEISNETATIDSDPVGHRRSSRHENYTGKNSFTTDDGFSEQIQVPHGSGTQVVSSKAVEVPQPTAEAVSTPPSTNLVPVHQRIVDENNKAIFMAEVVVQSLPGLEQKQKTRTGGTGKWSATLPAGQYRAQIKKRNKITKEQINTSFDFSVNNDLKNLELDTLIFN